VIARYTHYDPDGEYGCGGDGVCDAIEPEPECVEGLTHTWTSHGEGGCDSNPGVWSLGGTTYSFSAHCRWCGVRRVETLLGSQRNPDQCDTVCYESGERDETAITSEVRRLRRNRRARRQRELAAIAHYGSVAAWRAAVRQRRASVLARNVVRIEVAS
jgi:hypothetical protein